jgi:hypothetical protein
MIPILSSAQQQPDFDPAQMQKMMERYQDPAAMQKLQQQAEAAQKCMEGIDASQLEALRARAEAAGKQIETLCKAGKRAEALTKGLELSRELNADATVQKIRECSKEMSEMVQDMPWSQVKGFDDSKAEKTPTEDDICS